MADDSYSWFGQRLVQRGIITENQLKEAIHKQQTSMGTRKLGDILVRLGYISRSHIIEGLSDQLGVPIVRLHDRDIPERIRNLVEGNIAMLYRVVPIEEEGEALVIATADPANVSNMDNLSRLLDRPIKPVLATPEEIGNALQRYYNLKQHTVESMLSTVSSASTMSTLSTMSNVGSSVAGSSMSSVSVNSGDLSMSSLSVGDIGYDDSGSGASSPTDTDEDGDDSAVIRYVYNLIYEAFRLRASDIHVEPGKSDIKIRYRIDGVLHEMPTPPKRAQASIISRLKILSNMNITERRVPQDGRIKIALGGKTVDLRVSALPAYYGESVVMRILDKSGLMVELERLGFETEDRQSWDDLLSQGTGVVLVTGPTGSGKTTTLYASLNKLNKDDVKLITVEDPVEYQLTGINQVQIQHEIGWNFSRALRAIFRQDPDIVMVGEIRDIETAEIAIKAALTGHLVFSTLHTNDSASSFIRLIDMGVKPFLVASGVKAILAQRLVRLICSTCKEPYRPPDLEFERLGLPNIDPDKVTLYHGAGCDNCNHTGYSGRQGVYELLINNDTMRQLIMHGKSAMILRRQARADGMATLREDAWRKALKGVTTLEEVLKRTKVDEPMSYAIDQLKMHVEAVNELGLMWAVPVNSPQARSLAHG